jgi:hypothetical protein
VRPVSRNIPRVRSRTGSIRPTGCSTPRSTSDSPKSPIIAGMKLIPCNRSVLPNVKRA